MSARFNLLIAGAVAIVILTGILFFLPAEKPEVYVETETDVQEYVEEPEFSKKKIIGTSVEGRNIEAVTYGTGETHLLFVGGVHGGYEWNSSLLAYQFMDYIEENPEFLPEDIKISVIPVLNPDGMYIVTETEGKFVFSDIKDPDTRVSEGRFNANGVDLNRNFACKWQGESTWRGNVVSAGSEAFSEPETVALRDFVSEINPKAVVFWHSKANNVYASECEEGVLPKTLKVMNTYATAGNYGAVASFDAYPITGDAEGYLASIGIPAVTVELESHNSIEWTRNLSGVTALFKLYSSAK